MISSYVDFESISFAFIKSYSKTDEFYYVKIWKRIVLRCIEEL